MYRDSVQQVVIVTCCCWGESSAALTPQLLDRTANRDKGYNGVFLNLVKFQEIVNEQLLLHNVALELCM